MEILSECSDWLAAWMGRALLVSLVVAVLVWCGRRSSVLGRHGMVLWSLVGLLGLPVLMLFMPKVSLEWWPWPTGNEFAVSGDSGSGSMLFGVLGMVWLAGSAVALSRLISAARTVKGWRRSARRWTGWCLEAMSGRDIFVCEEIDRPLATGLWRPAILLPAAAQSWDRRRLRVVLLHEQAHIDRGDLWFQWLGRIAAAVYWFHPLVWWLSRQLIELREMATDERVVEQLGGDGRGYALELVRLAEEGATLGGCRREGQFLTVAAMAGENVSALERRVRCLLANRSRRANRSGILLLAPMAVVTLVMLAACCVPGGKQASVWTEDEVQMRLTADPFPGD